MARRIIRIRAEDSPNVQVGIEEEAKGLPPSHREVCPGVMSYATYLKLRSVLSPEQQCVVLDAQFFEQEEGDPCYVV